MFFIQFISVVFLISFFEALNCADLKCGYSKCQKLDPTKLNVHIIPQTHDDVGWRKTVDQYYYGNNRKYASGGVQYIIDSVIDELINDPNKRFIYVEITFFWKWWNEQDDHTKMLVKGLVENGQLEFTNGGMVSNDEAVTYYHEIIDQYTWGMRLINDTFGPCALPKIGWQIDPFGHSKEQASIYAQMGMDAFFFTRLDFDDRNNRWTKKELEFIWKGNDDLGPSSDIFTSILELGLGYGSPPGLCFDLLHCDDEHRQNDPVIDNPESEDYNVKQKVNDVMVYASMFSQRYRTKHVYIPVGSDFQFEAAQSYFKNFDKIIKYVNEKQKDGSNVNLLYSTPMCYVQAVYNSNLTFETHSGDFFPYGSDHHSYWTGYYTSRPALKYQERRANNILQICKQINSLALLKMDDDVIRLKEEVAIAQHHDAITGTENQHVAYDYSRRLSKGVHKCQNVINKGIKKLIKGKQSIDVPEQEFCEMLNISACHFTETHKPLTVTIYNPIGREIEYYVYLPITENYTLLNSSGKSIDFDVIEIPNYVKAIPERKSTSSAELLFKAIIPPLGFVTYFLKPLDAPLAYLTKTIPSQEFILKGKTISVKFDKNGGLKSVTLGNGKTIDITQSFYYYNSMNGDNKELTHRASGAYVFRPESSVTYDLGKNRKSVIYNRGKLVNEIQENFDVSWTSQTIRVYENEDFIEFDWTIGPIPVHDKKGKEIIIRFDSNLQNNGQFYTDANGRQMMQRKTNFRPFKYNVTEPISSNYYPITSRIYINDKNKDIQMTILNDRSQGGGSIKDGSIELMVHRRLTQDDDFGVHEALDEPGTDGKGLVIRGKTYLYLSTIDDSVKFHRDFAQKLFLSPVITFGQYDNETEYSKKYVTIYSALTKSLPKNAHLLTLEEWKNGFLLRFEHFYGSKDDPKGLSNNITIELEKLFKPFTIISAYETTLSANQFINDVKRLRFKSTDPSLPLINGTESITNLTVTLTPMQIRTFIVFVNPV